MTHKKPPFDPTRRFDPRFAPAILGVFAVLAHPQSQAAQYVVPLGARLKQGRVARGMTQEALARRSGVGKTTIYELESSFRHRFLHIMDSLSQTLSIKLGRLIVPQEVILKFARVAGADARGIDWVLDIEFEWLVELVRTVVVKQNRYGSIVDGFVLKGEPVFDEACVARVSAALDYLATQ